MKPKTANAVLALILLAVGCLTVLYACAKPFWYDELASVIVCRLPGPSAIWQALDHAADTNPPLFYWIGSAARRLVPDDHLGYRLPGILSFLGILACVYAMLARTVDRVSALAGAAFLLRTPLTYYAIEFRPYAPMLFFVSIAVLAWQRLDESPRYAVAFAIALALALSLFYYAILVWPVFVLAEASVWFWKHRWRRAAWLAIALGTVPLLLFHGLLAHVQSYYGRNFWARPSFSLMLSTPGYLLHIPGDWGALAAVAAAAILLYWGFRPTTESQKTALPAEASVLAAAFLLLPAIAVLAAMLGKAGMAPRYMLAGVLGGALGVGYLTSRTPPAIRAGVLALLLGAYGFSSLPLIYRATHGELLRDRAAAANEAAGMLALGRQTGLPVVVSSGMDYVRMAYYAPPGAGDGLMALADPPAALKYAHNDTVDLALRVLRQYSPLKVEDYGEFATRQHQFLLVSNGDEPWDWWPARFQREGQSMSLLSQTAKTRIYKVGNAGFSP